MTTQEECEWIMLGFGGQDLAGSEKENKIIIDKTVQRFLKDKKNNNGLYLRYLKDTGQLDEDLRKQIIINRINKLLAKESEYTLTKIENFIKN